MTLLTDPMGTSDPDWGRREPHLDISGGADAEALDIVQRFESRYAELAPVDEPPARTRTPFDDAFGDVSLDMSGNDFSQNARMPEPGRFDAPRATTFAGSGALRPSAARGDDMALDEAMALLRSVERKDIPGARDAVHAEQAEKTQPPVNRLASSVPRTVEASASSRKHSHAPSPQSRHGMLPRIAAAAALALVLGVGVGYFAAHVTEQPALAEDSSGSTGGAGLRIDYELRKR